MPIADFAVPCLLSVNVMYLRPSYMISASLELQKKMAGLSILQEEGSNDSTKEVCTDTEIIKVAKFVAAVRAKVFVILPDAFENKMIRSGWF